MSAEGHADRDIDREFDHVFLTRFSVRFGDSPPPDDQWLWYRWAFFCDALLPSMAAQTVRDFHWFVFFDIDTPEWLRREIEEKSPGLFTPQFIPYWSIDVILDAVATVASAPYLITTRLDSDDAVARQFVADVHDVFDQQDALYVNFLCGVQIERTGELYRYDEPSGPFISFIERRIGQPKTVFQSFRHAHSQRYADLLNIVGPPRWMQILHGSNLANSVRGLRARPEPYEADFPIDLPFERHVTTSQYLRQRTRSAFDLGRLWLLHPYFAREFVRARRLRRAGTMILPQSSSVGEQARYPEWVMRTGRPVVRAVRALDTAWRRRRGHRSNNAR